MNKVGPQLRVGNAKVWTVVPFPGAVESNVQRRTTRRGTNVVERTGLIIGVALLLLVSVCAFLLARRAARSIEEFREEHHESFLGKEQR